MSVVAGDIVFRKAAGGASEYGAMSGVAISGTPKNNLFPDETDGQRIAGGTEIRKWFMFNNNALDTMASPSTWIDIEPVSSEDWLAVGIDDSLDDDNQQGNMTVFTAAALAALVSSGVDARTAHLIGLNSAGIATEEDVVLTGATEKLSTTSWSVLYNVSLSATAALTVTVKQGAGGTLRGTIGSGKFSCFLWLQPLSYGSAIKRTALLAQDGYGFWEKLVWLPAAPGMRPDGSTLRIREG